MDRGSLVPVDVVPDFEGGSLVLENGVPRLSVGEEGRYASHNSTKSVRS